jgi:hypothetical protein
MEAEAFRCLRCHNAADVMVLLHLDCLDLAQPAEAAGLQV